MQQGGAEDQRQDASSFLAHSLVRAARYMEAEPLLANTVVRSERVLANAARSADSRDYAIEQVGDLHALLSLCRLRRPGSDIVAALQAVEDGRTRLYRAQMTRNAGTGS